MEEFISLGKWWLPSNPEVAVAGKLSFSPISGAKLELIGSFYNLPFQEIGKVKDLPEEDTKLLSENPKITGETIAFNYINREETIILGCLENNEEITLYKCSGSMSSVRLIEIDKPNFFFEATYIFRNVHFNTEQEIKFNSISVRYPNLEEWVGKSGIQPIWSPDENKVWISYQPPSSIPFVEFKELDMSITFSPIYINPLDIYFGATYYKGNVEQKTFLTLHDLQNKSINDCIKIIVHFRDFLTFAISKPSSILTVTGNINVTYDKAIPRDDGSYSFEKASREDQINILFAFGKSEKSFESTIFLHEMLFIYSDIEGNLGEIFKQWVDKKEDYESVFELFMITMYTPNLYVHYSFFNMIQALEAYYGAKYEGKYQEEVKYKNGIYNSLLEAINKFPSQNSSDPDGISDEFREVLIKKLDFINEYTLQTKLKEILKKVAHLLPDDFIGTASDRDTFISRASNTRHGLTHHKKEQKKRAAKGKELLQIFHTLKVMLQCCLLQELGFSDESIKKLIERTRNYQKEWRLSSRGIV